MVAFNFKARFVVPIELRIKRQTIRNVRKRNARPGDTLQLMTGPRFSPRRIGTAQCEAAGPIQITFGDAAKVHVEKVWATGFIEPEIMISATSLDSFAVRDGFGDWGDLEDFWRETHDPGLGWSGWWTFWGETFKGPLDD